MKDGVEFVTTVTTITAIKFVIRRWTLLISECSKRN